MLINIFELFKYEFIQNAFILAIIIALFLPIIGIIVYIKRIVFLADTLGQISMASVAFSVFVSNFIALNIFTNELVCFLMTICGTLLMQFLIKKNKENNIGLLAMHGIAIALVMIFLSLSENYSSTLFNVMFGNINSITHFDIISSFIVLSIIALFFIIFYKKIIIICIDPLIASLRNINIELYEYLIIIFISIAITILSKVIGVLAISILLIFPVLIASIKAKNLKSTFIYSCIITLITFIVGLLFSVIFDIPTSAIIVILNIGTYFICKGIKNE